MNFESGDLAKTEREREGEEEIEKKKTTKSFECIASGGVQCKQNVKVELRIECWVYQSRRDLNWW